MASGASERGFKALLEDIESKLGAVAENHGTLVKWCERLEARFSGVDERIGWIEQAMIERFQRVDESQRQTHTKLDQLLSRFDAHERAHSR